MRPQLGFPAGTFALQRLPGGTRQGDGGDSGESRFTDAENPARLAAQQLELAGG